MKELILELKSGNKVQKSWPLEKNKKYILGRGADVDIVIEEKSASRRHAKITVLPGGSANIQDLESANGTFVDGKPANPNQMVILRKGTQIVLAEMNTVLVLNEKIVETEDEEESDEVEEEKANEVAKKKSRKASSESLNEKKVNKQRGSRSRSPKNRVKKDSQSRSRSRSTSEEKDDDTSFQPTKKGITIKLPKKKTNQGEVKPTGVLWGKQEKKETETETETLKTNNFKELGLGSLDNTNKFLKLMGVKNPENIDKDSAKLLPGLKYLKKDMNEFSKKTNVMNRQLEYQFDQGVMRRGFGKSGLGSH